MNLKHFKLSDLNKPIEFGKKKPVKLSAVRYEDLLKKHINLIPEKTKREKQVESVRRFSAAIAVTVLAGSIGGTAFLSIRNTQIANDLSLLNSSISLQKNRIADQRLLDLLMQRINYKNDLIGYIKTTNYSAIAVLGTVEKHVSSDIQYLNVTFSSKESITITGSSGSPESVATLIHELKLEQDPKESNKPFFKEVLVDTLTKEQADSGKETGKYTFALNCTFGGTTHATEK